MPLQSLQTSADKTNPEKVAKELTMLLMHLTRFNERSRLESDLDMTWKPPLQVRGNYRWGHEIIKGIVG